MLYVLVSKHNLKYEIVFLFIQMASFDNHLTPYDVRILLNCGYTIFNKSSYERFI